MVIIVTFILNCAEYIQEENKANKYNLHGQFVPKEFRTVSKYFD